MSIGSSSLIISYPIDNLNEISNEPSNEFSNEPSHNSSYELTVILMAWPRDYDQEFSANFLTILSTPCDYRKAYHYLIDDPELVELVKIYRNQVIYDVPENVGLTNEFITLLYSYHEYWYPLDLDFLHVCLFFTNPISSHSTSASASTSTESIVTITSRLTICSPAASPESDAIVVTPIAYRAPRLPEVIHLAFVRDLILWTYERSHKISIPMD